MCDYIIASFPRSGNTLVRYIVEYITNRPTLGEGDHNWSTTVDGPILDRISIINNNGKNYKYSGAKTKPVAVKRHTILPSEMEGNKFLIYVFRSPVECIIRHYLHNHSLDSMFTPKNEYLDTLISMNETLFSNFVKGDFVLKSFIKYENLVFNKDLFEEEILKISNSFEPGYVSKTRLKNLINNFDKHKEIVQEFYQGRISFFEKADNPNYWANKLTEKQLIIMKEKIYNNDSLWNQIIKSWEE